MSEIADEYHAMVVACESLRKEVVDQLNELVKKADAKLALPIESRVKSLESIQEKSERTQSNITSLMDVGDLVGVRIILLYLDDLLPISDLISENFRINRTEDTADRLSPEQFGYKSMHFNVQIPEAWEEVPPFKGLKHIPIEIQVRTTAQHIWAMISHDLQYKFKHSVPRDIRRAIFRASALLELVDHEFSRILLARASYVKDISGKISEAEINADSLALFLIDQFPERMESKKQGMLLRELELLEVMSIPGLKTIIENNIDKALEIDKVRAEAVWEENDRSPAHNFGHDSKTGLYFTQSGIVRVILELHAGEDTYNSIQIKALKEEKSK